MGITNNSFPHLSNGDNVFSARRHRRQAGAERPEGDRCPLRGHPDLGLLLPCQASVRRLYAQAPLGQAFKVGPLPPPRAVPHPVQGDPWHGPSQDRPWRRCSPAHQAVRGRAAAVRPQEEGGRALCTPRPAPQAWPQVLHDPRLSPRRTPSRASTPSSQSSATKREDTLGSLSTPRLLFCRSSTTPLAFPCCYLSSFGRPCVVTFIGSPVWTDCAGQGLSLMQ